jgi:hypothetical protein
MTTTAAGEASLRRWNLAAGVLLVLYGLSLVVFVLSTLAPGFVASLHLGAYQKPSQWWPILLQVVLGVGAFLCYYRPRRRETRNFSVPVTGVLAGTTILVGLAAYWTCPSTEGQSPFWTPLTFALNLIVGNVQECYTDPNAPAFPPSLQLARLFGPLLLVIAALGIVTSIFRAQSDRVQVRFSTSLVTLVGLTDDAMPLLRRLSADREPGTTLAVLVAGSGNTLIKSARDLGARVVVCDLENTAGLRGLLTSSGKFKVRSLYAVAPDVALNMRWAAQFRAVADSTKPSRADMAPRMIVRIDDPWQAEYWRRTNAYRTSAGGVSVRWMSDALSVYEVTATLILDRIIDGREQHGFDRLVIVGNSALALAVCAELAQREREGAALSSPPHPSFADVILFGPDAEMLRAQHRLRQERFGNVTDTSLISVVEAEPTSDQLRAALRADRHPALILADDPTVSNSQLATYLAALNPGWTIFDWSPATRGVADEPIMELLFPFGLTTEAPSSVPVDSWERAARVVHEQYRINAGRQGTLSADSPASRPWEELEPFLKETNIRQVTTALAAAESIGRSWGPVVAGMTAEGLVSSTELSPAELDAMARMEHASWMKYQQDNGWRYGSPRDNRKRLHPSLREWDELSAADQQKTRDGVRDALGILQRLGYRSTVVRGGSVPVAESDGESRWVDVTRRGEVRAVRSTVDWTWQNEAGNPMQGRAGDWRVTNDEGRSWSVAPDIFAQTYQHLHEDRYRRIGDVVARPAVDGELISSLEGRQTARAGDWVIKGVSGEQWITSAEHFAANYERTDGAIIGAAGATAPPAPPAG